MKTASAGDEEGSKALCIVTCWLNLCGCIRRGFGRPGGGAGGIRNRGTIFCIRMPIGRLGRIGGLNIIGMPGTKEKKKLTSGIFYADNDHLTVKTYPLVVVAVVVIQAFSN